jgi:hypothetical protein
LSTNDQTEPLVPGTPYVCPTCGADEWKADYLEAVWQTISMVVGPDGTPEISTYTGVTGHYDDGSSEDECYRCSRCDYTIELGKFVFVPADPEPTVIVVLPPPGHGDRHQHVRMGAPSSSSTTAPASTADPATKRPRATGSKGSATSSATSPPTIPPAPSCSPRSPKRSRASSTATAHDTEVPSG